MSSPRRSSHLRAALLTASLTTLLACSEAGNTPTPDSAPLTDMSIAGEQRVDTALPDAALPDAALPDAPLPDAQPWSCPTYAGAASTGKISAAAINETSGLAVSAKNPGVLWLHNDSGDTPRVFAISTSAKLLGQYTLSGAMATDWEDMALGPGPVAGTSYLYLADIGDNAEQRTSVTVYRVAEPSVSPSQPPAQITLSGVEALPLVYPDGAHNAETLLIDPQTGDLYIVAKSVTSPAGIYLSKAPQQPGTQRTLSKLGALTYWATGGDIAADGSEILLRSYLGAHLWHWPAGTTLAAALALPPCLVKAAAEPQGEAIAFVPQTKDYYTLSESSGQALYFYQRK